MSVEKIGWILLAVACVAFVVSLLFGLIFGWESDESRRAFSVCMPVTAVCFIGAAIAVVIDHIKKKCFAAVCIGELK